MGVLAAPAGAITRNKAEGLANAKTSEDCDRGFLYVCVHEDLSECQNSHVNHEIAVQWWCTEVYVQKPKLLGHERVCHRALGYNPKGRLLTSEKLECQPVGLRA